MILFTISSVNTFMVSLYSQSLLVRNIECTIIVQFRINLVKKQTKQNYYLGVWLYFDRQVATVQFCRAIKFSF